MSEDQFPPQQVVNGVSDISWVANATDLVEAVDRVRAAKAAWEGYAGNPTPEVARELLDASRMLETAMRRYHR